MDHKNVITFAFDQLNNVAGEYSMVLYGHSLGNKVDTWNLGKINVWFVAGESETTNNHILPAYRTQADFMASYPPKDYEGVFALSCAICALIACFFLYYTSQQLGLVQSLTKFSVSGFFLTISLLALIALILLFWIGVVNLVQTLYILIGTAPVTILSLHRGLAKTQITI